ncbi:MAG TPA: ABC transporter substrate-binding protein [Candidatus Sulfotelmatobacter sp.]|nr:ABC transporter substrate-binding protein [Candidatus Sulfotelmatobacter sp.]
MAGGSSHAKIRIVSLAPNVTSILLELGVGRELVGVSKWCKDVADVGRRPQVGDCWKMNIAEVMRLKPTILIGSVPFASDTVAKILAEAVTFVAINPRSLADIENDIRTLGRIANRAANAEKLILKLTRSFAAVAGAAKTNRAKHRPRVYCEAWPKPRISSPPWVAELVQLAGGTMVGAAGERVTDEEVAREKPDVIVLAWAATGNRAKSAGALRNPAWQDVPAVRNRRVFVIRDELLNTPGPPLINGAWELLRVIHGT